MNMPVFTGLHELDELTGGFKPGELVIFGGRPAMGKTSFALKLLERTGIETGEGCLIWSLEESKDRLVRRLYAFHSGNNYAGNQKKAEVDLFRKQYIENGPVWIDDAISGDLDYTISRWEEFKSAYNLRFIIVDYIQLISSPMRLHLCLQCLKSCAQRLSIPIIVLSQINQIPESRTDKRPILSDLRWIDCVDPVDQILFLYREDYYYRDAEQYNIAEFILAKHPEGKNGTAKVLFHYTSQSFLVYSDNT